MYDASFEKSLEEIRFYDKYNGSHVAEEVEAFLKTLEGLGEGLTEEFKKIIEEVHYYGFLKGYDV